MNGDPDSAPAPRVALVTGARKGIGRAASEWLLRRGYRVVGCSRSAADWRAPGCQHVQADVSDEPRVQGMFREVRQEYGRLDVVVHAAGIAATMNHTFLTPARTVDDLMRVNVLGTFLINREAVRMSANKGTVASSTLDRPRSRSDWPAKRPTSRQKNQSSRSHRSWRGSSRRLGSP